MPVKDCKTKSPAGSRTRQHVTIRFRLRGDKKTCRFLNKLAGVNRYLWNAALAKAKEDYAETGQSQTSQFDFYKWYKVHKDTVAPWLREYPVNATRTGLKDLADAYKQFFKKKRGFPRFKKRGKAKKSFSVDVSGGKMFSTNGYVRLKRGMHMKMLRFYRVNRYTNPVPKTARIFEENGNWYMTVVYEVDATLQYADGIGIGVDRNCGQIADSAGRIFYLTDTSGIEKRIQKLQRRLAKKQKGSHSWRKLKKTIARHERKIKNIRRNDLRHIALSLTEISTLVILEDLKTKGMTASAKGTVENPGRNVKQKAGLNRSILGTGWAILEQFLRERGVVIKVPPHYTSQTCSKCSCVNAKNRQKQSEFLCLACGYQANADTNASVNIRVSGMASWHELCRTGCGAYVRPVIAERKPATGQRVMKHQKDYAVSCY